MVYCRVIKLFSKKTDMGKSCIRFKNPKTIPFGLIGELSKKITGKDWIAMYENYIVQNKSCRHLYSLQL
ncbi:hypothetical protein A8C56_02255 [Niabella ginsenosidivorans]|uniref:Uncharacterized protein n=1 Tax=Niabella ginsenosidivorans TaxID=1176587 RepID=A0A1A9I077_9BACT|nr:hypothetical protein A8C56_02255 [Niabella ginsenosidivorans]